MVERHDISKFVSDLRQSATVRVMIILGLILLIQIPAIFILLAIEERSSMRSTAVQDIATTWGGSQQVSGPVVAVPYDYFWVDQQDKTQHQLRWAYFLPDRLEVEGEALVEERYRGIFKVPVYRSEIRLAGEFAKADPDGIGVEAAKLRWRDALLIVGVSDTKAIKNGMQLNWGGELIDFQPGTGGSGHLPSGVHVRIGERVRQVDGQVPFELTISLNGNQVLSFLPVGIDSTVKLRSKWPDPKFMGAYLPTNREVTGEGFSATWQIPHLGRDFPQKFRQDQVASYTLNEASFGVDFLSPVDAYRMTTRSVKYEIMIVFLTFMSFYMFEVFTKLRIHPIQYLLVGGALSLFYLLTLSLAEHIGFDVAYGLATAVVVGLVAFYASAVLRASKYGLALSAFLLVQYGFFYLLLTIQDYSLLIGTAGLTVILAVSMYLTRNIDWYRIHEGGKAE